MNSEFYIQQNPPLILKATQTAVTTEGQGAHRSQGPRATAICYAIS